MNENDYLLAPDLELDRYLEAFESANAAYPQDLDSFLPPKSHPKYREILLELIRVDLELAWDRGDERTLAYYEQRFPDLFSDPAIRSAIVKEEARQRKASGLDVDSHPRTSATDVAPRWLGKHFPKAGELLPPDFRILRELGRGAFGRVYLAEETGLAQRWVAVKVSSKLVQEAQTLARLQHTNIVPIYSATRLGDFHVVVMPYFGAATLADVLAVIRISDTLPLRAETLASAVLSKSVPRSDEPTDTETTEDKLIPALHHWENRSYTEAILELGAQLAAALHHAHERGILHRDLKPANILLTDDGRPMLLDFNLAADEQETEETPLGGTPRYMAPEQLEAMLHTHTTVGPPADLYSLGLILYELLIGRLPFAEHQGPWRDVVRHALDERQQPLTIQHDSPALTALLQRCLAPVPAQRYQSAHELQVDLERHLTNQALVTAREPWSRERFRKWVKRHPRVTSGTSVGIMAGAIIFVLSVTAYFTRESLRSYAANDAFDRAVKIRQTVQPLVLDRHAPTSQFLDVREQLQGSLRDYEQGLNSQHARYLSKEQHYALAQTLAELWFTEVEATAFLAERNRRGGKSVSAMLEEALRRNEQALQFGTHFQRPLLLQRIHLLNLLQRPDEIQRLQQQLNDAPTEAVEDFQAQRYRDASTKLKTLVLSEHSYSSWMALGIAYWRLHEYDLAADAFQAATAIEPNSHWAFFYRGIVLLELKQFRRAKDAFDRFIELKPTEPHGHLNRALALLQLNEATAALYDLDHAEKVGSTGPRLWSLREQCYRQLKQPKLAAAAHQTALQATATDADGWTIQGELQLANSPPDATAALKAFDEALQLDAEHLPALRGKASVLAEHLQRSKDALIPLKSLLQLNPRAVEDRAGYAVLLARLKDTEHARTEARRCVQEAVQPLTLYQAASALALTAQKLEERREVLETLREVLKREAKWADEMARDPDLQSVQQEPTFRALLQAAGVLNSPPK